MSGNSCQSDIWYGMVAVPLAGVNTILYKYDLCSQLPLSQMKTPQVGTAAGKMPSPARRSAPQRSLSSNAGGITGRNHPHTRKSSPNSHADGPNKGKKAAPGCTGAAFVSSPRRLWESRFAALLNQRSTRFFLLLSQVPDRTSGQRTARGTVRQTQWHPPPVPA